MPSWHERLEENCAGQERLVCELREDVDADSRAGQRGPRRDARGHEAQPQSRG